MVENLEQLSQSWKCTQTITNYSHAVEQMVFSPDGKTLASSRGERGCIKLWDVVSGKEIYTFFDNNVMAFSQDSKILAGGIYFWDLATGRASSKIAENFDSHWNIAISPDFQIVASYQRHERPDVIKLWEIANGREICALPPLGEQFDPQRYYRLTKFSPDGQIFVAVIGDRLQELKLWEATTGGEICTIAAKDLGGCTCVAFSPDGQILASAWITSEGKDTWITAGGKSSGVILLSEVATGKQLCRIKIFGEFFDLVWSLAFSPDGQILANGRTTGKLELRQLGSSWLQPLAVKKIRTLSKSSINSVQSIAFSPDGRTLASNTGDDNYGITLWNVESGSQIKTLSGQPEQVYGSVLHLCKG